MKKMLVGLACLAATTGFAQIRKNDMLLGGTFGAGFNSNSQYGLSQGNTNISPLFQWGYKDNRTLGFSLGMNYYNYSQDNNRQESLSIVPAVVFTQYHSIKGRWGWYLQEELGAGFQSTTNTNSTGDKTKSSATLAYGGVRPGVYVMPGSSGRWLLFGSVGGADVSYRAQKDGPTTWSVNLNLFSYYQFGFGWLLGRQQ